MLQDDDLSKFQEGHELIKKYGVKDELDKLGMYIRFHEKQHNESEKLIPSEINKEIILDMQSKYNQALNKLISSNVLPKLEKIGIQYYELNFSSYTPPSKKNSPNKHVEELLENINLKNLSQSNEEKIKEIFTHLILENKNFGLAHLWILLLPHINMPTDNAVEYIGRLFLEVNSKIVQKNHYRCSNCNQEYARWPSPNPEPPYREDLRCHKCGKFDTVEPIR